MKIKCDNCGASWDIHENRTDCLSVDVGYYEGNEYCFYKCPNCGKEFWVSIYYKKQFTDIQYE